MQEIEVKILGAKHKELEEKLFSLGAKKIFDGELYAEFFDNGFNIRDAKECFRLRKEGEKVVITHKKKSDRSSGAKVREETEIIVSDFDKAKELILALGFKVFETLRKRRVSYKKGNIKFEFDKYQDQYSHVPEFMEIEGDNEEDIFRYAEILGFTREDCKDWSGKHLVKIYSKD